MIIRLSGFQNLSGGVPTIRKGALIRRNMLDKFCNFVNVVSFMCAFDFNPEIFAGSNIHT